MHEPPPLEESRVSRTVMLWLAGLLLANLVFGVLLWQGAAEPSIERPVVEAVAGERLRLLRELPEEEQARRAAVENTPAAAEAHGASEQLLCLAWGPFTDSAVVDGLRDELEGVGRALEVRETEIAGDPDYLVYVSTGNSQDVARRTLSELQTQSVDAYVIAGGPFINAVSVGVFSEASRADAQRDRVADLGYDVSVQTLERAQTVYHLFGLVPESYAATADDATSCEAIASRR